MIFTPKIFTEYSTLSPGPSMTVKTYIIRNSLHLLPEVFYFQNKNAVWEVCATKSNYKAIRASIMLCSSIPNIMGHTKIN